jgi:D-alanyl-D-alanine carboxypeptidase (penicillin-binding protein 5/6)
MIVLTCGIIFALASMRDSKEDYEVPIVFATQEAIVWKPYFYPKVPPNVQFMTTSFSQSAILYCVDTNEVVAQKNAYVRMFPASLTKMVSCLVAIENTPNLNAYYSIPDGIIEPLAEENAALAGFKVGEEVRIIDILYGAMLPSGADATAMLSFYLFGSEEGMAAKMNEKMESLGLEKTTHFVNSSGMPDPNHYSTAADMAVFLAHAWQNPIFRQIMTTRKYEIAPTEFHKDGFTFWHGVLGRLDNFQIAPNITIMAGKTGYTEAAGSCLASIAWDSETNQNYILVNLKSVSEDRWPHIADAVNMYNEYVGHGFAPVDTSEATETEAVTEVIAPIATTPATETSEAIETVATAE